MKKSELRQIIKEEIKYLISESPAGPTASRKIGSKVKIKNGSSRGKVVKKTNIGGDEYYLVKWDKPVDSGDGVVSHEQFVRSDLLEKA